MIRTLLFPFALAFNFVRFVIWLLRTVIGRFLQLVGTRLFRAGWTLLCLYALFQGLEFGACLIMFALGIGVSFFGRLSAQFLLPRQSLKSRFVLPRAPQLAAKPVDLRPKAEKITPLARDTRRRGTSPPLVRQTLPNPPHDHSPSEAEALATLPETLRRFMR